MKTVGEKKQFHLFLDFPYELRMEIIDKMSTGDRIMFSKSSRLCNKEAKASKNYLFELFFCVPFKKMATILVLHTDVRQQKETDKHRSENLDKDVFERRMYYLWMEENHEGIWKTFFPTYEWYGYFLRFLYHSEDHDVGRPNLEEPLWKGEVDKVEDVIPSSTNKFKELLCTYQHTVKRLVLRDWPRENDDFGIHHFRCLEELIFHTETNYEHFLSKVRTPLKILKIKGSNYKDSFTKMQQIYQVRDRLILPFAKFNSEQLLRISASYFKIHIGYLTENDILKFIRLWQHGTKIKNCRWNLESSNFNVAKFLRLLGINNPNPNGQKMKIQHEIEWGRFAELEYTTSELKFDDICEKQLLDHVNIVDSEIIQA